jgi:hypothetical protein
LLERVNQSTQNVTALQLDLDKAVAAQVALTTDLKLKPADAKKFAEAKAAVETLQAKVTAAKASLAKWTAALQAEKTRPNARRISMRE